MPSMFWGGFGQGVSGGLRQGQDIVLKAKEHKLRAKMLENQAEQMQLETQKRREDLEERDRQRRAGEAFAQELTAEFTGGRPGVPGFEDPTQQMSVAPVPAQPGARQMDWRQRGMVEAARSGKVPYGELFKQQSPTQVRGIAPGSFVPDPNAPGGFRQIGEKPTTAERPVSVAPGGTVINPKTGQPIFTAPSKPEKPERPITVAPGGTVLDPTTNQPIFTAPNRPTAQTGDVPPVANFKNAKTQLESMASKYGRKDMAKVKAELEGKANGLGYTIQSVRPGALYGWNIDIAPISPNRRKQAGQPQSKEDRLKGLGF